RKSPLWHLRGIDAKFPGGDSHSDEEVDLALVVCLSADEHDAARGADTGPASSRVAGNCFSRWYGSSQYSCPGKLRARSGRDFSRAEFLLARSNRYAVHRSPV